MVEHTPTPWKVVSSVNFDSGLTYVSVQSVEADAERDTALKMMNGEYHICRMSHTAARWRIALYEANAEFIVTAVNSHASLVEENERLRKALENIANAPAWGAPDRWDTTPSEVRQLARSALTKEGSK